MAENDQNQNQNQDGDNATIRALRSKIDELTNASKQQEELFAETVKKLKELETKNMTEEERAKAEREELKTKAEKAESAQQALQNAEEKAKNLLNARLASLDAEARKVVEPLLGNGSNIEKLEKLELVNQLAGSNERKTQGGGNPPKTENLSNGQKSYDFKNPPPLSAWYEPKKEEGNIA